MAGYSGTPLPKKLGIREGHRVALLDAPRGFERTLGALPTGAAARRDLAGREPLDVLVLFAPRRAGLARRIAAARRRMAPNAGLWVAWPKASSGVATDMREDVVRQIALPTGLVDNKVCAIDETWSGLRLVIRISQRG